MRCEHVQRFLIDFIEDELGGEDRESVQGHLDSCLNCRSELEAFRSILDVTKRYPLSVRGEVFWANYLPSVRAKIQRKRVRRWIPRLALGSALVLVLILSFFLTKESFIKPQRQTGDRWSFDASDIEYPTQYIELADIVMDRLITDGMLADLESIDTIGLSVSSIEYESQAEDEFGWLLVEKLVGVEQGLEEAFDDYTIEMTRLEELIDELDEDEWGELLDRIEARSSDNRRSSRRG